jgi:uncharacterized protein (TIGR02466 family)
MQRDGGRAAFARQDHHGSIAMSGTFNFTFRLGDLAQTAEVPALDATPSAQSAAPAPAGPARAPSPMLRSFDLFPTRIWQARVDPLAPQLQRWVHEVLALRAANPSPAASTNRHGWSSTDMSVLEQPAFAELRQAVRTACATALGEMGRGGTDFNLESWVNLHDRGGFNVLHLHAGSLLSGSFYLQVPPGSGQFVFRDPRPGIIHGCIKGAVPNGRSDIRLTPAAGLLVLFPCWMEHYVEPHDNDTPRITIAFNATAADSEAAARSSV